MAVLVRIVIKRLAFVFDYGSFESVYFPEVPYSVLKNDDAISLNKDNSVLINQKEKLPNRSEIYINYELQIPINFIIKSVTREFLDFERHNSSLLLVHKKEYLNSLNLQRYLHLFSPDIDFDSNSIKFDGVIVLNTTNDTAWIPFPKATVEFNIKRNRKMVDPLSMRQYALDELMDSEQKYITDLKYITDDYMEEMSKPSDIPLPENLKEKTKFIFMNILGILDWHQKFIKHLEKCYNNPIEFRPTFEKCYRKFEIYATYHHRKYQSDLLVSDNKEYFEKLRIKFKHQLEIDDLLITPIQRLSKYPSLLDKIVEHSKEAGFEEEAQSVEVAKNLMKKMAKMSNKMMDVGRIQNYDGKIQIQGSLLKKGKLRVIYGETVPKKRNQIIDKMKEYQVFLFEQSIMFTETLNRSSMHSLYQFKHIIPVNKMILEWFKPDPTIFIIKSTDPKKPKLFYACTDPVENDKKLKTNDDSKPTHCVKWYEKISDLLEKQQNLKRLLEAPQGFSQMFK